MSDKKIKLKPNKHYCIYHPDTEISGWFSGKRTYLWFGMKTCIATIDGSTLYALAKRIVKEFESEKK